MKPYKDQQKSIDEIFEEFHNKDRLLFQLPTGGGKTAVFSFIAKRFIKEYQKKILVLAHRDELITQTLNTLRDIGVSCESVIASKKSLKHNANAYVGMIQTLKNRLRNNPLFVKEIGLIIIDEAHLDLHKEVFDYFQDAKILAVTATPSSLKKINFTRCHRCKKEYDTITECCNYETYEYTRKFSYSEIYEHIILGQSISELILSDSMKNLLEKLKESYDYILIDTPPVGLVTDALILINYSDITFAVVRANYTRKEFIKNLDRLSKEHSHNHIGMILNGVEIGDKYGYGYGVSYGYGYGNGKYYKNR